MVEVCPRKVSFFFGAGALALCEARAEGGEGVCVFRVVANTNELHRSRNDTENGVRRRELIMFGLAPTLVFFEEESDNG